MKQFQAEHYEWMRVVLGFAVLIALGYTVRVVAVETNLFAWCMENQTLTVLIAIAVGVLVGCTILALALCKVSSEADEKAEKFNERSAK